MVLQWLPRAGQNVRQQQKFTDGYDQNGSWAGDPFSHLSHSILRVHGRPRGAQSSGRVFKAKIGVCTNLVEWFYLLALREYGQLHNGSSCPPHALCERRRLALECVPQLEQQPSSTDSMSGRCETLKAAQHRGSHWFRLQHICSAEAYTACSASNRCACRTYRTRAGTPQT